MKKEVANIPFLKQVFACMKAIPLDRSDIRQGMKVILQVSEEVKNGRNYLIFAEGTRSKNQNHLLDFKGGSFKSAVKAKCPIVPIALIILINLLIQTLFEKLNSTGSFFGARFL